MNPWKFPKPFVEKLVPGSLACDQEVIWIFLHATCDTRESTYSWWIMASLRSCCERPMAHSAAAAPGQEFRVVQAEKDETEESILWLRTSEVRSSAPVVDRPICQRPRSNTQHSPTEAKDIDMLSL